MIEYLFERTQRARCHRANLQPDPARQLADVPVSSNMFLEAAEELLRETVEDNRYLKMLLEACSIPPGDATPLKTARMA